MGKKRSSKLSLIKVTVDKNYKNSLLTELSTMNAVHIKLKNKEERKILEEKDPLVGKIKDLRRDLDLLFDKLEIFENDFLDLKGAKIQKVEFGAKNIIDLINHINEEINFYMNRITELKRYSSKDQIELEKLKVINNCYTFLESLNLKRESLTTFNQLNFKVFTTFSKNVINLKNLFKFSEFPNFYQTFEISEERIGFYIIYPKDKEDDFKGRLRLIHSEEVPIMKKYLTAEGINITRINREIAYIESELSRYQKEQERIVKENLLKFAAFDEVVQNVEEYNWAERQFEDLASNRLIIKFFIPVSQKQEIHDNLFQRFKENIIIDSIDVSKKIPTYETDDLKSSIKEKKPKGYKEGPIDKSETVEEEDEKKDLREETPTIMKNNIIVRPFETITRMYGTPAYSEIDPTPIIAITFPILFGLMFGDVGHGLVLIIAGLIGAIKYRNREGDIVNLCWIIFYCGWASFGVGFLYGEIFGRHELVVFGQVLIYLRPIMIPILNITLYNPMHNIITVFKFAVLVGVFHICLGWFIQFLNYWKQKRKYLGLSDSLVKISLLVGGAILIFTFGFDINSWMEPPYPILLVLIPGVLLLLLKPFGKFFRLSYLKEETFGGLLGEGSIEAFDTILSVMSNVASYIRLLALALAHIALLLSINAMVGLIEGEGIGFEILTIIGLVIGNMVVILLEGLLVFLNTMRLHFYEFFFKFYQGSGIDYFPFYLESDFSTMNFQEIFDKDIISEEIDKEFESQSATRQDIDDAYKYITKKYT